MFGGVEVRHTPITCEPPATEDEKSRYKQHDEPP
jgi:hypothetical protein